MCVLSLFTSDFLIALFFSLSFLSFSLSFWFLGPFSWHMHVPRLGVKSELQLPAYATAVQDPSHVCNLHNSSQQSRIAWSPTHWARPGSNPHPHGYWLDLFPLCHRRNSLVFLFELTFFSFLKTILIFLIYITPCDLVKYFSWYISMLTFKLNKTHCMFVYSGLNVGDCIVVSTIYEKLPVIQDKETIKWEIIM